MANAEHETVTDATGLALALSENSGILYIKGALAPALIFSRLSIRFLQAGSVAFFMLMFMSVSMPEVMLPAAMVCAGVLLVSTLPLFYLYFAGVPFSALRAVKKRYHTVRFHHGRRELFLLHRGRLQGHGISDLAWMRKYRPEFRKSRVRKNTGSEQTLEVALEEMRKDGAGQTSSVEMIKSKIERSRAREGSGSLTERGGDEDPVGSAGAASAGRDGKGGAEGADGKGGKGVRDDADRRIGSDAGAKAKAKTDPEQSSAAAGGASSGVVQTLESALSEMRTKSAGRGAQSGAGSGVAASYRRGKDRPRV